ncbi:MAG: PEP-CTERM sorting domain-containing protein [Bythopirellula sp.]
MKWYLKLYLCSAALACLLLPATFAAAQDRDWIGGGGDDLWTTGANWSGGVAPTAADAARFKVDGTTTLIDGSVNATASFFELGWGGPTSASNTINMTGGSLTAHGGLSNIGRGTNDDPAHKVEFNMSGGVIDVRGIAIPEAFDPGSSIGLNTELDVSGDSIINTGFMRLGAFNASSLVTIRDNAQINILAIGTLGFTNGSLWLESGFAGTGDGPVNSNFDIRDNAVLTVHGLHFTGTDNAATSSIATQEEFDFYVANYVDTGLMTANGGANFVDASFANSVMTFQVGTAIPEPSTAALLLLSCPLIMMVRRRR